MSLLFGGNPKIPPAPPAPKTTDMAVENAVNAERLRRMRARGRQSTMLTAGLDMAPAPIQRSRLLGS